MTQKYPFVSYNERIFVLKKLYQLIKKNEKEIIDVLFQDLGKHHYEAYFSEIGLVLHEIKHVIKNLKKWMKPKKVRTPFTLFGGKSFLIPQAYGQCLIISPWNYPFYLTLMPLISSIAAGNRNIVKTSEFTLATSSLLSNLINDQLQSDMAYVMDHNVESIIQILENKFDFVFFTGSEKTGTKIAQSIAKYHTPSVLELGGKCPVIIDNSVVLGKIVSRIMSAKLLNAGQTCIAPDYVCVPKGQGSKFKELCQKYIEITLPNLDDFPKIITYNHYQRIKNYIAAHKSDIENECKIYPQVIDATWSDQVMQDEIFGPVLPIIEYENIDELIDVINSKNQPLATYLFTKNNDLINKISQKIKTGGLVVNDLLVQLVSNNLPFGGVGSSGNGRSHGFEGFKQFSNIISCYHRKRFALSLTEHPYTDFKEKIFRKIFK